MRANRGAGKCQLSSELFVFTSLDWSGNVEIKAKARKSVCACGDQLLGDHKENLFCVINLKGISTAKWKVLRTYFPTNNAPLGQVLWRLKKRSLCCLLRVDGARRLNEMKMTEYRWCEKWWWICWILWGWKDSALCCPALWSDFHQRLLCAWPRRRLVSMHCGRHHLCVFLQRGPSTTSDF